MNTTVLLALVLAHLLGDFVFQSNDLLQKKYKSWLGSFEHVCIIAFFAAVFLFPYWTHKETWVAVGVIFVTHFFQDMFKVYYDQKFNTTKSTLPYFSDQALHLMVLALLAEMFLKLEPIQLVAWAERLYFNSWLSTYLLGAVLFTTVFDITRFQFLRQKNKKNLVYTPNLAQMKTRFLLFSAGYLLLLMVYGSLV